MEDSRRGECKMIISSCEWFVFIFPVILVVDAKLSPWSLLVTFVTWLFSP